MLFFLIRHCTKLHISFKMTKSTNNALILLCTPNECLMFLRDIFRAMYKWKKDAESADITTKKYIHIPSIVNPGCYCIPSNFSFFLFLSSHATGDKKMKIKFGYMYMYMCAQGSVFSVRDYYVHCLEINMFTIAEWRKPLQSILFAKFCDLSGKVDRKWSGINEHYFD